MLCFFWCVVRLVFFRKWLISLAVFFFLWEKEGVVMRDCSRVMVLVVSGGVFIFFVVSLMVI